MVIAAIIAEYNPFHKGHAYQIEQTRAQGATHIVAIMSGNYTQRGTPAIADKRVRAACALRGGADLVIELPLPFAMSPAQRFAYGAVSLAKGLGCVDTLSFGSESGSLSLLLAAADAIDDPRVGERVREILTRGITYARARQQAVEELYGADVASMVASPNDSLGVEYLRQLKLQASAITPYVVQRYGVGHHQQEEQQGYASASMIRRLWEQEGIGGVTHLIPPACIEILEEAAAKGSAPLDQEKFASLMLPVLRKLDLDKIRALPDISEGLEHRIYTAIREGTSLQEIWELAKSKRYTAARIRRVIMAGFLGLEDRLGSTPPPYLRVLGLNQRGREILAAAKAKALLPISDSLATLAKRDEISRQFAYAEAAAVDLYNLALPIIQPCGYDFTANSMRML